MQLHSMARLHQHEPDWCLQAQVEKSAPQGAKGAVARR